MPLTCTYICSLYSIDLVGGWQVVGKYRHAFGGGIHPNLQAARVVASYRINNIPTQV